MNILFIDDDPDDIQLYEEAIKYLNESEYLPSTNQKLTWRAYQRCDNIIQILAGLKDKPDLIFLDINMPGVDGKQCLSELKTQPTYSGTNVVMLSTSCTKEQAKEFQSMGAMGCIQKPTDFNQLIKLFSKFIFQRI